MIRFAVAQAGNNPDHLLHVVSTGRIRISTAQSILSEVVERKYDLRRHISAAGATGNAERTKQRIQILKRGITSRAYPDWWQAGKGWSLEVRGTTLIARCAEPGHDKIVEYFDSMLPPSPRELAARRREKELMQRSIRQRLQLQRRLSKTVEPKITPATLAGAVDWMEDNKQKVGLAHVVVDWDSMKAAGYIKDYKGQAEEQLVISPEARPFLDVVQDVLDAASKGERVPLGYFIQSKKRMLKIAPLDKLDNEYRVYDFSELSRRALRRGDPAGGEEVSEMVRAIRESVPHPEYLESNGGHWRITSSGYFFFVGCPSRVHELVDEYLWEHHRLRSPIFKLNYEQDRTGP